MESDSEFDIPDDEIEIIYSDSDEDGLDEENIEEMIEGIEINEAEVVDLAKFTFTKHAKSVFCSDLSGDSKLAVTGGQDDVAYVWDTESGEVVLECTGHKDSVTEVAFNHNDQYVATADMCGMIQVWDVADKKLIWCFEGDDMLWLTWHPMANVLVVGFQTGDIYIWQIPSGNTKVLPTASSMPTTCGKILPNGKQLLASYEDGILKLWDIKTSTAVWQNKQETPALQLAVNADASLAMLSPSSSLVKLTDGRTVSTLLSSGETEIEVALFESEMNLLVTGGLSGRLCVWESGKHALRHEAQIECPVTILKWGKNGQIFIGGSDGAIYVCNVKLGTLVETLTGHRSGILSISVFKDGRKILTTSDDGVAKIFDVKI
ncbi:unnamed protein product [Brassicogethes aeneus]|uniref:Angio-associated migratory cell protein n=1 Tax=Brassicogethes aeneus TaxID=1431903 RepID=A0A9P0FIH3_BRAAE|nr:unnamed protein product [Brassicogethes aeneus]